MTLASDLLSMIRVFSLVFFMDSSSIEHPNPIVCCTTIHIGIYVDDFILYVLDSIEEKWSITALEKHVVVNFMGQINWFLGTAFPWKSHKFGNVSVHLLQSAFTKFLTVLLSQSSNCTKYDSIQIRPFCWCIPPPPKRDPDQNHHTKCYQSIVVSIN